jgi:hypothetical protein
MVRTVCIPTTLLLLLVPIAPVASFAAWLKCYVDLLDETEIIMNHPITPASKARIPGVSLQIKLADSDQWLDVDGSNNQNSTAPLLMYPADQMTLVTVRLKVPAELSYGVQYVVEVLGGEEEGSGGGAEFVRPKMCDGRRGHAAHYAESAVLEITGTTDTVTLLGAYATGHEAVTLTEPVRLERRQEDRPVETEL